MRYSVDKKIFEICPEIQFRITSYNVCYTKLLRKKIKYLRKNEYEMIKK